MRNILLGAFLLLTACSKETTEPQQPIKTKFEYGYSSLAEAMDSLGMKPGVEYRYRAWRGKPNVDAPNDSGTVTFRMRDTTAAAYGTLFAGDFKFSVPDFDKSADRRIMFSQHDTTYPGVYPFMGVSGYGIVYKTDTYMWQGIDKTYQYTPDTTKLVWSGGAAGNYSVFLYH